MKITTVSVLAALDIHTQEPDITNFLILPLPFDNPHLPHNHRLEDENRAP